MVQTPITKSVRKITCLPFGKQTVFGLALFYHTQPNLAFQNMKALKKLATAICQGSNCAFSCICATSWNTSVESPT